MNYEEPPPLLGQRLRQKPFWVKMGFGAWVGLVSALIAFLSWCATSRQADIAERTRQDAVEAAKRQDEKDRKATERQDRKDSEEKSSQTLKDQIASKAIAASQHQSERSAAAAEKSAIIAKESLTNQIHSLDASIRSSMLDQRAWVSVEIKADNINVGIGDNAFLSGGPVSIVLRNTGKTPALKVTGGDCFWWRAEPEGIPDYETVIATKFDIFDIKQPICNDFVKGITRGGEGYINPIWARVPVNSVIAPAASEDIDVMGYFKTPIQTMTEGYPPGFEGARRQGLPPNHYSHMVTDYVVGKIVYSDVFDGTPQRITRFCFMNHNAVFKGCPIGNSMQ